MPTNSIQSTAIEIIIYTAAMFSTLLVGDWFLDVIMATCTVLIAKITDHYFRKKIIAWIDRLRNKLKNRRK